VLRPVLRPHEPRHGSPPKCCVATERKGGARNGHARPRAPPHARTRAPAPRSTTRSSGVQGRKHAGRPNRGLFLVGRTTWGASSAFFLQFSRRRSAALRKRLPAVFSWKDVVSPRASTAPPWAPRAPQRSHAVQTDERSSRRRPPHQPRRWGAAASPGQLVTMLTMSFVPRGRSGGTPASRTSSSH
jgi:hypothetical protein